MLCRISRSKKKIQRLGLRRNSYEKGQLIGSILTKKGLNSSKLKIIGDVRGLSGFWSLEIVKDKENKEPFPASLKVASQLLLNV